MPGPSKAMMLSTICQAARDWQPLKGSWWASRAHMGRQGVVSPSLKGLWSEVLLLGLRGLPRLPRCGQAGHATGPDVAARRRRGRRARVGRRR